jgi:hypothetical protein
MKHLLAVLIATCLFGSIGKAQNLLAIDDQGEVYRLNTATGKGTFYKSTGLSDTNAMAALSDTKFYVASGNGDGTSSIYELNYIPWQVTLVAIVPLGSIRALARRPPDEIYAINAVPSGPDDLYRVDLALGTATLIGPTGFSGVEALTFAGGATFFAWDVGDGSGNGAGLLTINTSTGAGTDVNPSAGGTDAVMTLAFSEQGQLYGGRDQLYVIQPATGQIALVGSGGYSDVRGMEGTFGGDVFCKGKTSSLGCWAYLFGSFGSVSKSGAPPANLMAGPVPGGSTQTGILIYSRLAPMTPVMTSFGFLCISQFQRAGAFPSFPGGDTGFCNGLYQWDLAAITAGSPTILVGDQVSVQGWYRDPGFPPPGNANFTGLFGPIPIVP